MDVDSSAPTVHLHPWWALSPGWVLVLLVPGRIPAEPLPPLLPVLADVEPAVLWHLQWAQWGWMSPYLMVFYALRLFRVVAVATVVSVIVEDTTVGPNIAHPTSRREHALGCDDPNLNHAFDLAFLCADSACHVPRHSPILPGMFPNQRLLIRLTVLNADGHGIILAE